VTHIHDPSQKIETWGLNGMKAHLERHHPDVSIPMRWGVAELHQAHLKAHQQAAEGLHQAVRDRLSQLDTECGAYYGVGDGTSAICRRPAGHPEVGEDGIGHSPQPIPVRPPEEAPMPESSTDDDLEAHAKALYESEFPSAKEGLGSWNGIGQETRDFYRAKAKAEQTVSTTPAHGETGIQRATSEKANGILRDRIVAAMAGLDFDQQWAHDRGIGPAGRGAVRKAYGQSAERLLTWLERGGALHLPTVASLAADLDREQARVKDMERANDSLREQLRMAQEANERQVKMITTLEEQLAPMLRERDEMRAQLATDQREQGVSLDAVQRRLEEVTREWDRLRMDKARLKTDLEQSQRQRQGLFEEMGELRRQLEAVSTGDSQAGLGMATTGAMLEEIRTRIDLGHCGLDYCTVDGDETDG
jgi:hypothetical protein